MSDARLLYVTTPNIEEARTIASTLMDLKLVACANILPQMESIYRWEGKIQNDKECVLILKTELAKVPEATAKIVEIHSYEVPCVLALKVESGAPGYLKWLAEQT